MSKHRGMKKLSLLFLIVTAACTPQVVTTAADVPPTVLPSPTHTATAVDEEDWTDVPLPTPN